jgi:hypothetical protein
VEFQQEMLATIPIVIGFLKDSNEYIRGAARDCFSVFRAQGMHSPVRSKHLVA